MRNFCHLPLLAALFLSVVTGLSSGAVEPAKAYTSLAPVTAPVFATLGESATDSVAKGHVPNILRLLAVNHSATVVPFANLWKTVIYGGTLRPEVKEAMGMRIAAEVGSPYLRAHLTRLLKTTPAGLEMLEALGRTEPPKPADRAALRYATLLTRAIHGVGDTEFATVRTHFNDAQIVELTLTTCFFNYYARLAQGAGLPVEDWVQEKPDTLPIHSVPDESARITLASDAEMQTAARLSQPQPDLKKGLGIGIANSQRAMLRVPDIAAAWWGYWQSVRDAASLQRPMLLQISFAVSMANGCRYCTLHQVAGLRRVGVEPAKLLAMQKDDSALDAREMAAVTFARKLTKYATTMTEQDFTALQSGLGNEKEALDALMQTCAFSFMNRFTDGLRLPSEEEAVRVYQEVYGKGAYRAFPVR